MRAPHVHIRKVERFVRRANRRVMHRRCKGENRWTGPSLRNASSPLHTASTLRSSSPHAALHALRYIFEMHLHRSSRSAPQVHWSHLSYYVTVHLRYRARRTKDGTKEAVWPPVYCIPLFTSSSLGAKQHLVPFASAMRTTEGFREAYAGCTHLW